MTFKVALMEWCICDSCGEIMSLMDHWNQDGICIKCFGAWIDEMDPLTKKSERK
ncbi:hypothetical protein [Cellulosilyticum sp. I15G10I2]|uniref:hypothetical protein n=1 Tax=Cellulosilyticum sp. I15G10I2 TaxID=1892843 RepID=UPI00149580B8|nr:hypothetical protein [Cellulosilyticum sp. I15G10I2]